MCADVAEPAGDAWASASVGITDEAVQVLDWRPGLDPSTAHPRPATPADVAPLFVDVGELLTRDTSRQVVDAWLVLLLLSATADALWILADRSRARLDATATAPLSHAGALEAIAEARQLRSHPGSAFPPPSGQTVLWRRWTDISQVFELGAEEMRQLFAGQHTFGPPVVDVPPAVASKIDTVAGVVTVLQYRLKPERISPVVRLPADAYRGVSMLQMIEADRHEELARSLAESFNWSSTA
jgi:hypothetical protein